MGKDEANGLQSRLAVVQDHFIEIGRDSHTVFTDGVIGAVSKYWSCDHIYASVFVGHASYGAFQVAPDSCIECVGLRTHVTEIEGVIHSLCRPSEVCCRSHMASVVP